MKRQPANCQFSAPNSSTLCQPLTVILLSYRGENVSVGGRGAGEGPTATAPSTVTLQTEELMALQLSLQQEFNYITFVQRNIQINYIKRRCLNKLYAGVGTITIQSSCLKLKHLQFMSA